MIKPTKKGLLLTHAVLASTFFVAPLANAAVINGNANPFTASVIDTFLEVLPAGQVTNGDTTKDVVILDVAGSVLQLDANNTNANNAAVLVTGAGTSDGVEVTADSTVNIFPGTAIYSNTAGATNGDGIIANGAVATVNNQGTVASDEFSAISVGGAGGGLILNNTVNSLLTNNLGGGLVGTQATLLVDPSATGTITITNAGTITQTSAAASAFDAILMQAPFTSITNNQGGIIQVTTGGAATGDAINLTGATVTAGNIVNNFGGTIQVTGPLATGSAIFIDKTVNSTGGLTNSGVIRATVGSAITLNGQFDGSDNNDRSVLNTATGQISVTSAAASDGAIFSDLGSVFSGTVENFGTISANTLNKIAVDFLTNPVNVTFMQSGGVINGEIRLGKADAGGGSNFFIMADGIINGDVNGTAVSVTPHTFDLNGGTINGNVLMGANGDTINLNGTNVIGTLTGGGANDTFNLTAGSFGLLQGAGGDDTVNVLATFTANGVIDNVEFINVLAGVFTQNGEITNLGSGIAVGGGVSIFSGAEMISNANITTAGPADINIKAGGILNVPGTVKFDLSSTADNNVINSGQMQIGPVGVLTIVPNVATVEPAFDNKSGGTFNPQILGLTFPGGTPTAGDLIVTPSADLGAITLEAGSFVAPTFALSFIPNGSTFIVAEVQGGLGGTIIDNSTLVQPPSAIVHFTKELINGASQLQLTTANSSFVSLVGSGVTSGIAGNLDFIAANNGLGNPDFINLLAQFQQLATQDQVEQAMQSLIPDFNYGIVAATQLGMNLVFDASWDRLNELHMDRPNKRRRVATNASAQAPIQVASNGLNYGDPNGSVGTWARIVGAHLDQGHRDGVAGYRVNAGGAAIGADWGVNDCTTLGLALSYMKANVDDKAQNPKDSSIKSWQGTAYGWFEFTHGLFLDALVGYAHHDIHNNREINVNALHTAANSSYNGHQWGVQGDLGWSLVDCEQYYFAPFARLRYTQLDLDNYTESGAGSLNLSVTNHNIDEFLGGLGFKLGSAIDCGDVVWVPELTAMIGYDFEQDGQLTAAGFTGGGLVFQTPGVKPGRTVFDLGLGLNADVSACSTFTLKYNLELRDKFVGNAAYLQYYYMF